jgi:hypothetical protein
LHQNVFGGDSDRDFLDKSADMCVNSSTNLLTCRQLDVAQESNGNEFNLEFSPIVYRLTVYMSKHHTLREPHHLLIKRTPIRTSLCHVSHQVSAAMLAVWASLAAPFSAQTPIPQTVRAFLRSLRPCQCPALGVRLEDSTPRAFGPEQGRCTQVNSLARHDNLLVHT